MKSPGSPLALPPWMAGATPWLMPIALGAVLLAAQSYHHPLFHFLVEAFDAAVVVLVAVIGWHSYALSRNRFVAYISGGYLWIALLGIAHAVTYHGMGILPRDHSLDAIQLGAGAKLLEALLFLSAPLLCERVGRGTVAAGFGAGALFIGWGVFSGAMPEMFIPGQGSTPLKLFASLATVSMLAAAIALFHRHRERIGEPLTRGLGLALLLMMAGDLLLVGNVDFGQGQVVVAHGLRFIAYWVIFFALVSSVLTEPFRVLARGANTFDAIPDPIVLIDEKGTICQTNAAARAYLGNGDAGIIGRHCHALLHAPGVTVEECPVCRAIAAGAPVTGLEVKRHGVRWLQISLSPINAGGGFQGMVHACHDITEQREAERALRRSEQAYCTLVDNLPQSVFLKDVASRVISCNRRFAQLLNRPFKEIIGRSTEELHPPTLAEMYRTEDQRVMAAGQPVAFDHELELDGVTTIVHTVKVPVKNEQGEVIGLLGMLSDVTEERRAARALHDSQMLYQALLQNASDAILVGNDEGRFIDANRRAEEMFGYTRQEFLELGPVDIHAPENQANLKSAFSQMNQKGYSLMEHRLRRKDGTVFDAEASGTRITFGGRPIYLGNFRDISHRKRSQEELRIYREDLERMVGERTAELKAMNRELEAFSYSVSHDLRSPLRAINGFGEALREELAGQLTPECHDYLDRMSAATVRMAELIDGLLNLSQVSRCQINVTEVELSRLAAGIANALREHEPERDVSVTIESGLRAMGDETLLRVLMENLLRNAWKFTRKRAAARIEVGRRKVEGGEAFYVRDNGAGFDMQFAHKLFQPFERLHEEREFKGTGIGLATVRRIVERHGGRVWAESDLEQGAAIYFSLNAKVA